MKNLRKKLESLSVLVVFTFGSFLLSVSAVKAEPSATWTSGVVAEYANTNAHINNGAVAFKNINISSVVISQPGSTVWGGTQGNDKAVTVTINFDDGKQVEVAGSINWTNQSSLIYFGVTFATTFDDTYSFLDSLNKVTYVFPLPGYELELAGQLNLSREISTIQGDGSFTDNEMGVLAAALQNAFPTNTAPVFAEDGDFAGSYTDGAYAFTYNEGAADATVLGQVAATDADGDALTFSITSGNTNSWFAIDEATGAITLTSAGATAGVASNDYEIDPNGWTLTVTVSDGLTTTPITVTLSVTDVDDTAPTISWPSGAGVVTQGTSSAITVDENQTAVVQVVGGDNVTSASQLTWVLTGPDNGKFSISNDGTITFLEAPDFENPLDTGDTSGNNTYVVEITAEDLAGNTYTHTLVVTVAQVLYPGEPLPTNEDYDNDGTADTIESDTADRDGDDIKDRFDYDPQGYFYCQADGRILTGGSVAVIGPGTVTMVKNGSATGEYQWYVDQPGTYTMSIDTSGMEFSTIAASSAGSLTLSTQPGNPIVIGSTQNGSTGYLGAFNGTPYDAENPTAYYTSFEIAEGDPNVFGNNIPFEGCSISQVTIVADQNGREPNGSSTQDGLFRIDLDRVSPVDTVITYSVSGSATSGTDYVALTETITIPAGETTAYITVLVLDDDIAETTETVQVTLEIVTGDSAMVLGSNPRAAIVITEDLVDEVRVPLTSLLQDDFDRTISNQSRTFAQMSRGAADRLMDRSGGGCERQISDVLQSNPLLFDDGSAVIQSQSFATIDVIAETLLGCPEQGFVIAGHTDNVGLVNGNLELSARRAGSVKAALIQRGISDTQLATRGFGETRPVADNSTEEGRALNRRVEFSEADVSRSSVLRSNGCGTQKPFDVDGTATANQDGANVSAQFGGETIDCLTGETHLTYGDFAYTSTDGLGTQGMLTFGMARERETSDAIVGRFVGGYLSQYSVAGLGGEGEISGVGANAGMYSARSMENGLILDYYGAAALGYHQYDMKFFDRIDVEGEYSYAAIFGGVGLTGSVKYGTFELRPRLSLDLGYGVASDPTVRATELGVTDSGSLKLDPAKGIRGTIETAFIFGEDADPDDGGPWSRFAVTPMLYCENGYGARESDCGYGLSVEAEKADLIRGVNWKAGLSFEGTGATTRTGVTLSHERKVFDGLGTLSTGALVEGASGARLSQTLELQW